MAYIRTSAITVALAKWLRDWKRDPQDADPYFGLVAKYDAPELIRALNDLLSYDQARVALIVPGSEDYTGANVSGQPHLRQRVSQIVVILALKDVDYIPATVADSTEIAEFQDVIDLKDDILDALDPEAIDVPGVDLIPIGGAPQDIRDEANPDQRLWRAWLMRLQTPAGSREYGQDTFVY